MINHKMMDGLFGKLQIANLLYIFVFTSGGTSKTTEAIRIIDSICQTFWCFKLKVLTVNEWGWNEFIVELRARDCVNWIFNENLQFANIYQSESLLFS